jgi:hypothetical protein
MLLFQIAIKTALIQQPQPLFIKEESLNIPLLVQEELGVSMCRLETD